MLDPRGARSYRPTTSAREAVLAMVVALAVIAPLVAVALYAHATVEEALLADGARERASSAAVAAGILQRELDLIGMELIEEADEEDNITAIRSGDLDELRDTVQQIATDIPIGTAFAFLDAEARTVVNSRGTQWPQAQEHLRHALGSPSWSVVPAWDAPVSSVVVTIAIRDDHGSAGALVIELDPSLLLGSLSEWGGVPGRAIAIHDENGQRIAGVGAADPSDPDRLLASGRLTTPPWSVYLLDDRDIATAYAAELLVRLDLALALAILGVALISALRARQHLRARDQQRALQRQAEEQAALLQALSDLGEILLVEAGGRLAAWNQAALHLTGFSERELKEMPCLLDLFAPEAAEDLALIEYEHGRVEVGLRTKAGPPLWGEVARQRLPGDRGSLLIVRDVTARRAMQQALELHATHDELTGLPNRALFDDRLTQAVVAHRRDGGSFALLVLDLDGFKRVNDTLGHPSGDLLLSEVARRLRGAVREGDTIARLGGDEFAALVAVGDAAGAAAVAEKLQAALRTSFVIEGNEVGISSSIGIAFAPTDGSEPVTLLRRADLAMYEAKRQGGGSRFYAEELERRMLDEVRVVSELGRAIAEDELEIFYQPKVDVLTRRTVGVEALVRWQHPEKGLLQPAEFVPPAVRAGLDRELDQWVLRRALAGSRALRHLGADLPVSVNVGAHLVEDPRFTEIVRAALREADVPADRLVLELTEATALSDPESVGRRMRELVENGVRIAIDDFGTGYSSLVVLRHIPATELKVDRGFVRNMRTSPSEALIVRAALGVAQSLGLTATAEGVEDEETLAALAKLGCHQAQGYLLSRPVAMSGLVRWLIGRGDIQDTSAIRSAALALAETAGLEPSTARHRLHLDREQIAPVLSWTIDAGEVETGLRLAAALRFYWTDAGLLNEGRAYLETLLSRAEMVGAKIRAEALNALGVVSGQQGDLAAASVTFAGAVTAARSAEEPLTLARSLANLGVLATFTDDLDAAEAYTLEASRLFELAGDRRAFGLELNNLAGIEHRRGDRAAAREAALRAVRALRGLGDVRLLADALETYAAIATTERDLGVAREAYAEALGLYQGIGVKGDVAQAVMGVAVLVTESDPHVALRLAGAAESLRLRHGSKPSLLAGELERILARLRARLPGAEHDDELVRGRNLTGDEVVALALDALVEAGPTEVYGPRKAPAPGYARAAAAA